MILDEESHQVSRLILKHPNKLFGVKFPLMSVLDPFCSVDSLSKQLLSPEKFKGSGKVFERAVSWLLATSGLFSVIKLDEFEKLNVKETNFAMGTADLIAYAPRYSMIYVISCTLALPQEKDVVGVKECADYLTKEVFAKRHVKMEAALVTPKKDTDRIKEECNKRGVRLLNGRDIEDLLEKIRVGDADGFQSIWGLYD